MIILTNILTTPLNIPSSTHESIETQSVYSINQQYNHHHQCNQHQYNNDHYHQSSLSSIIITMKQYQIIYI